MYKSPPENFRGFVSEPTTEQDVVILFGRLLNQLETPVAVDHAWTPFPDCTAIATVHHDLNQTVRIEFEYRSSSFGSHRAEWIQLTGADPSARWWVVCWHDDLDAKRRQQLPELEVVSLRNLLLKNGRAQAEKIVLNWYDGDPSDPIRPEDAERKFDWRAEGLSEPQRHIVDRLRQCNDATDCKVEWLPKPDLPCFTVRVAGIECFKVGANGTINVPCSRWPVPTQRRTAALAKLSDTLENEWFEGREMKKKGCDVTYLFRNPDAVDPFIEVMRQLAL